ncbi:MAG TPA: Hsp20/alpha crystallin family protein [Burkholderiales bacterium]|nr:Hsp20/alpha crystallin family protein [Burkholderiales bacterium]
MADITRYDPFRELDDMMRGMVFRPVRMPEPRIEQIKVDATEDDKAYRISAEIPGVRKEDIKVSVVDNEVTISAEVKSQSEKKEGERVVHSERYYGAVARSFTLPQAVDEEGAQAKYENGVLTLTLPKRGNTRMRKIAVT